MAVCRGAQAGLPNLLELSGRALLGKTFHTLRAGKTLHHCKGFAVVFFFPCLF